MMQENAIRTLGTWSIGVLLGLGVACAGGDTPPRDRQLEEDVAVKYAGRQVASAAGAGGGGGMGGSGGSAQPSGGSGGSGTMMTGGSTGMPPAGGSGGGTSGGCDGFALLQSNCSGANCHSAGSLSTFVASEAAADSFVGQTSSFCSAQGDMSPIFDPDAPAASLVVKKITASTSCGGRMPIGAMTQAFTDDELDCIEEWISGL